MVGRMSTALVWFRLDLRLRDNPALAAALDAHARVLPVYVHAPEEEAPWQPGAASGWWLHHSLAALDESLRERGSALHLARGPTLAALRRLVRETGADAVYWNRRYEPAVVERDAAIEAALAEDGVAVRGFNASLFADPGTVRNGQGEPYKVFTPFWRNLRATLLPQAPSPLPRAVPSPPIGRGAALDEFDLLPTIPWDRGFYESWTPGEAGARRRLADFLDGAVAGYAGQRDVPGVDGTSRLSPHLHFGEISPRQILWAIERMAEQHPQRAAALRTAAEPFLREVGWREFSYHLLRHQPHTPSHNLDPRFDAFPWARRNERVLERWRRGRTGVPIVDAGMRQLWHTGWMHNRVRMLVASFLTKNLRQHWLHGARWFWDTLVDADLANNTQGWQWTAGCGADAAPYFRIFNPVTQGERFDPAGDYVRHWVPELARVTGKAIHAPWTDPSALKRCGYPAPMVDLGQSREEALAAYRSLGAKS